jgi:hypothetical protein
MIMSHGKYPSIIFRTAPAFSCHGHHGTTTSEAHHRERQAHRAATRTDEAPPAPGTAGRTAPGTRTRPRHPERMETRHPREITRSTRGTACRSRGSTRAPGMILPTTTTTHQGHQDGHAAGHDSGHTTRTPGRDPCREGMGRPWTPGGLDPSRDHRPSWQMVQALRAGITKRIFHTATIR